MKKSFQVVLGLMALLSAMVLRAEIPAAKPGPG
jgi:hypothetical protein